MKHTARLRRGVIALALLLIGALAVTIAGMSQSRAAACGCTGEFAAPKTAPAKITPAANSTTSPGGGTYTLQVQGGTGGGTLRITRADGTGSPYDITIDSRTNGWGFAPDGKTFLTYGQQTQLHDLADRRVLFSLDTNATVGFSADGEWALARWVQGNVPVARLYNATNGQIRNIDGSDQIPNPDVIGFGPDSKSLLVATNSATRLYQVENGKRVLERTGAPAGAFFSPDGGHLVTVTMIGSQAELRVIETQSGRQIFTGSFTASTVPIVSESWDKSKPQSSGGFGFSPDGRTFVVAANEASTTLRVIDLASGDVVISRGISGGAGWAFGPCGDVIAVVTGSSSSMTVSLSSVRSGDQITSMTMPAGSLELKADADNYLADLGQDQRVLAPNLPCAVVAFTLPTQVQSGGTFMQRFALDRPAPDGGFVVELKSSDSDALAVPAKVTIAAGKTSAEAELRGLDVSADTSVTVTGSYRQGKATVEVKSSTTVRSTSIAEVQVSPDQVYAGEPAQVEVTLNTPAPAGGLPITLRSSDPSVTVAGTLTITAGQTQGAAALETTDVDSAKDVTIAASHRSQEVTATLKVLPRVPTATTAMLVAPIVPAGADLSVFAGVAAADPDTSPGDAPSGAVAVLSAGSQGSWAIRGRGDLEDAGADVPTGQVQIVASGLAVGTHEVRVQYRGDRMYLPSETTVEVEVVDGSLWTGDGDGSRWSDRQNWHDDVAPVSGDHVFIDVPRAQELVNDIAGLELAGLHQTGGQLSGEQLTVEMARLTSATIALDLRLDDTVKITTTGTSWIRGTLHGDGDLEVDGGQRWVNGQIRSGRSVLHVSGASSWTGTTTIARSGAVSVDHDQALGSVDGTTELYGRLCLGSGVRSAEPVTSHGGTLNGCPPGEVNDDHPQTPVLTGPVQNVDGLRFFCTSPAENYDGSDVYDAEQGYTHLEVGGSISGPGSVTICGGRLALTGAQANTWSGGTTMSTSPVGDYFPRTELVLAKADHLVALPGDITGDTVVVRADGQIAADAHLHLHTLDLGVHDSAAGQLRLDPETFPVWVTRHVEHGLIVGVDGAEAGSIAVTGAVEISDNIATYVGRDADHGSEHTVVTSGGPVTGCPTDPLDATVSGSDRIDYRVKCASRQIDLRAVWHSHLEISSDPQIIALRPTITVKVIGPDGAPVADSGTIALRRVYYEYNQWVVSDAAPRSEAPVRSGSSVHDGVQLMDYDTVAGFYDGDDQYGAASSELLRMWHPGTSGYPPVPDAPTAFEIWVDHPGDNAVQLRWKGSGHVSAYRVNVSGSDGSSWYVDTNITTPDYGWRVSGQPVTNWDLFNGRSYRTLTDLDPDVTYTFTVQQINPSGWSAESQPIVWREIASENPAEVPSAPSAVVATVDGSTAVIRWDAPDDDGGSEVTHYVVRVDPEDGESWQVVTDDTATTVSLDDLAPGRYMFTVRAENLVGLGPVSEPSAAVTVAEPTGGPTPEPTDGPTPEPTDEPTPEPTPTPTPEPTPTKDPADPKQTGPKQSGPPDRPAPTTPTAAAPTPAQAEPTEDPAPVPGAADEQAPEGQVDHSSPVVGGQVMLSAAGFAPGEQVRIELHSTPTLIGTVAADDAGNVRTQVTIPADAEPGKHTLHLDGLESGLNVQIPVTVLAAPSSDGGSSSWMWPVAVTMLLMAAGTAFVLRRRAG